MILIKMNKNKEQSNIHELDSKEFKQKLKSLSNKFANEKKKNLLINSIKYQMKKDKIK